ncbi:MAG: hypothetical protein KDC44_05045 [Phaeodactylibacter sp.]|nr:hypothetical protein [Phaeodactylibacter sp.]
MQQSRLIQVLKSLESRDFRLFEEFVHSDYFNKNEKVRALCSYILQFKPDFESSGLDKERAYECVYGSATYNRFQLNNLLSDLFQLLLFFLSVEQVRPQIDVFQGALIQQLLTRDFDRFAELELGKFEQAIEQQPFRNFTYFHQKYRLHELADRHFLRQAKRSKDPNLQEASDALDRYYWTSKLRIASEMISRNILLNAGYEPHFLDDLLATNSAVVQVPAVKVYRKVVELLLAPTEASVYFELKKELLAHSTLFPPQELQNLYGYALNFCIRQINFGHSAFYGEALDLYQALLERELLIQDGYLSMWTFRNIVTTGIRTGAFEWTEQFIETYQHDLQEQDRANAVQYNRAAYYYARKNYKAALQQLHDVEFTDNFYQIGAKTIQLKIYFELMETEALFALTTAFRKYLSRHRQLSDYHRQSNQHFIKLSLQLYKLRSGKQHWSKSIYQKRFGQLQEQLQELSPVANLDWLREQWAILEGS